MKKIIFILAVAVLVALGVGVYFFQTFAQEAQLNLTADNDASGRKVTLSWINPSINLAKIKIYQSNNKKNIGTLAAEVTEIAGGQNSTVTIDNLIAKQLYYFTAIGEKSSGQKLTLGQIADEPHKYPSNIILAAQNQAGLTMIRVFGADNQLLNEFLPYGGDFKGQIDMARIDLDGDGIDEIAVVPSQNSSTVKIFRQNGELISTWDVYEPGFKSGLAMTAVDVDNLDAQEKFLAIGPMSGAAKHKVKIYRYDPEQPSKFSLQDEIAPFDGFNGGVNLSAGDFNGDGRNELIASPIGGAAEVKIFKYGTNQRFAAPSGVFDHIFPYGKIEKQDVKVAAFDMNRDGKEELIVYPMKGRSTIIKVYECEIHNDSDCLAKEIDAKQVFDDHFKGGVNVSVFEGANNDERYMLVSPQQSGGPHLKLYQWDKKLKLVKEFFAYSQKFTGGVQAVAVKIKDKIEIITVPQKNGGPHLRAFDVPSGALQTEFFTFDPSFNKSLLVR